MNAATAQPYVDQYPQIAARLPGHGLGWLSEARRAALNRFAQGGFPTPREEEWRWTNVAPIERKLFAPGFTEGSGAAAAALITPLIIPECDRLVFIDGYFDAAWSDVRDLPDGMFVAPMSAALEQHGSRIQTFFGETQRAEDHGFVHFNTAWFTDGAFIYLRAGVQAERPLQLIFVASRPELLACVRNLIVVEAGARVPVIEACAGAGAAGYLYAGITEVVAGKEACIDYCKLQTEGDHGYHFGGFYAQLSCGATLEHHSYAYGSALARSEVHADLSDGAVANLYGLYVADGRRHLDQHVRLQHREPRGLSRVVYRGIAEGRGRGVFQGRIVVHPDAQHTDAQMHNDNLLLSDDAEIDTKPQLEIYADDVKCAHGVTVGRLDEQAVFFLASRGIDPQAARHLLTYAFANELVGKIKHDGWRRLVRAPLLAHSPLPALEEFA